MGHDIYVSDLERIKGPGSSTHVICAWCHTLFKVTATHDGIPEWRWEKLE